MLLNGNDGRPCCLAKRRYREMVKPRVTLQLESKTGALAVVIGVVVVIVLGGRFFAGVGVAFTGVLVCCSSSQLR